MTTATYTLEVDWDNDGSFATSGDDISDDLLSAVIDRGFDSPLARMASVGRAEFVVKNTSKDYSPAYNAAAQPRLPVRFRMTYAATTVTLFRGYIEAIVPDGGLYRSRRATLQCVDAIALLDLHDGVTPLLEGVSADEVIETVVDAVYTPPSTDYQAGINVFPFAADRWTPQTVRGFVGGAMVTAGREELRASQKILDACLSDWGRFFISKAGAPTFYNRHQTALDTSTVLTADSLMPEIGYRKDVASVFNLVEVTCHPRAVSQTLEVLGRISQTTAPAIEAGASATFSLSFRDPSNASLSIGGKSVLEPVQSTDFVCTTDEAGHGTDVSASVSVSMDAYSDRVDVTLTNAHAGPVYVQTLQVRGFAVRSRGTVTVKAEDAASQTAHQRRDLPVSAPMLSSPAAAQRLADYLLDVHRNPADEVRGVVISANRNATLMAAVRDIDLLDRVVLTEPQLGLSAFAGFVFRMQHRIASKFDHRLILDVETAYDVGGTPIRLSTSTFNSGHILIY